MASASISRAFATHRLATTRSIVTRIPSRHASTSVLYGISALSNRHETQYFSKLSRLPLMEHSPTLKLIHTSEVQRGDRSIPSSSARTKQPREEEHGDVEQKKDDVQTEMNKRGEELAYTELQNKETSSLGHERLSNNRNWHWESKVAHLEKQLVQSQEAVLKLQQESKKHEDAVVVNSCGGNRGIGFLQVVMLLFVGVWMMEQQQRFIVHRVQSSIEENVAEITSILEHAGISAGSVADGNEDLQSNNHLASPEQFGTDGSSLLKTSTRSWSSLFWKKH